MGVIEEDLCSLEQKQQNPEKLKCVQRIKWHHVLGFVFLHMAAVYAVSLTFEAKWQTWLAHFVIAWISGFGVTAGAHRLWSHRSYKARLPLRIFFMCAHSMAFQHHIIEWVHLHRCHHKWSDTDADPYNPKRGFFFAHMGWELVEKHPEVARKGHTLDMADLEEDPVLAFQRWFWPGFGLLFAFIIPTAIPVLWGESLWVSFFIVGGGLGLWVIIGIAAGGVVLLLLLIIVGVALVKRKRAAGMHKPSGDHSGTTMTAKDDSGAGMATKDDPGAGIATKDLFCGTEVDHGIGTKELFNTTEADTSNASLNLASVEK